jgi:hypothetical protein
MAIVCILIIFIVSFVGSQVIDWVVIKPLNYGVKKFIQLYDQKKHALKVGNNDLNIK